MRYVMQALTMLGDIALVVCVVIIWFNAPVYLSLIMTFMAWYAWKDSGGFMAWRPSEIRKFLNNAKELGL